MTKATLSQTVELDELDRRIINRLQEGFPLVAEPFAVVAAELDCCPEDLVARLASLRRRNIVTRFGPFIDAVAIGGAFCLCAMAVPPDQFDSVAETVNSFHQVAHNYERDHVLNMWFVLATETPAGIEAVASSIENRTGLSVHCFPKLEEYFIGFRVAA